MVVNLPPNIGHEILFFIGGGAQLASHTKRINITHQVNLICEEI
jgi:hypothetical protein